MAFSRGTPLLDRLRAGDRLVADGALGTSLLARGLKMGQLPEQLNLENPDLLREIAAQYVQSGADIIHTNTFGGSPVKLAQYGLEDQTEAINRAAVSTVRAEAGDKCLVSGSCGPCGGLLEPYGDVSEGRARTGFELQIRALVDAGVDLITVETMTDLAEAKIAVAAARTVAPDLPICATLTFDQTPSGFRTLMGTSVADAVRELTAAGADVLGSNCGIGSAQMIEIAHAFRQETALPLLIQPNAGLPVLKDDQPFYPETPEIMAEACRGLLAVGVNIVGGCCGTTPAHVAAIRQVVDEFQEELA